MKKRLLVGISGASGAPLAVELLRELRDIPQVESHVILSRCGELTLAQETGMTREDVEALCTRLYDNRDYGGAPASGSFQALGMVIVPCSMKTRGGVRILRHPAASGGGCDLEGAPSPGAGAPGVPL